MLFSFGEDGFSTWTPNSPTLQNCTVDLSMFAYANGTVRVSSLIIIYLKAWCM